MAQRYTVGVDFGTLSGRAVLVEINTGREVATAIKEYSHGVMSECLPDGVTKLGQDWALQHPADYLEVLQETIPAVLKQCDIGADEVVGIGIDFTCCTVLPTLSDGTPLCMAPGYEHEPHAYVKLWKHHAAQREANELNRIAAERGEAFLDLYGGKISSEWLIPKIWQILNEAPEVYDAMERFLEAGDWVTWQLCGKEVRNSPAAGYKAIYNKRKGYPSNEFFKALDPRLEHVVEEKLSRKLTPNGRKAGELTEYGAKLTGLLPGTAVAVSTIDAHVSVPAVGITGPGKMLMIIGTSTCDIMMGTEEKIVPGMCGVVEDGVQEGYFGYEAGQSCVGDHFDWFVKNCVPAAYEREAEQKKIGIHELLTEKAQVLRPGESGLVALDWWNGNRSVLVDADLTGVIAGMTLASKPEEIYRALIEATAYGKRMIVDTFRDNGVPIEELYAAGGIAQKNPMMMQIYADVTNMEIRIGASSQIPALGAAMFAAVAAGKQAGGYDSIVDAAKVMGKVTDTVYRPIPEHVKIYDRLYQEYRILHDYFGRGENDVLKRLKQLKKDVKTKC